MATTIKEEMDRISKAKAGIIEEIRAKGVDVPVGTAIDGLPEQVRKIQTGVPGGVDTSDATATAAMVRSGYTFYGANGKASGTLENYAGSTSVMPKATSQTLSTAGTYMESDVTVTGSTYLSPENIKKDVTIFGVVGTYEGKESGGNEQYLTKAHFDGITLPENMTLTMPHCTDVNFSRSLGVKELDLTLSDEISSLAETFLAGSPPSLRTLSIHSSLAGVEKWDRAFQGQSQLETIDAELNFSSLTAAPVQTFGGCTKLKEVRFAENSVHFSLDLKDSPLLSADSLVSIANGLIADAGQMLILHDDALGVCKTIKGNVEGGTFVQSGSGATTLYDFIFTTKGWALNFNTTLANNTWAQIQAASLSGVASSIWKVGDEITIKIPYTGSYEYVLVIIGFDHDDLEEGGKAGISFSLKGLLYDQTKAGGGYKAIKYTDRTLYTTLEDIYANSLPPDLKSVVRSVKKKTFESRTNDMYTDVVKLFCFSCMELTGSQYSTQPTTDVEGAQYEYYTDQEHLKKIRYSQYSAEDWWTRSAAGTDDAVIYVRANGTIQPGTHTESKGLCFGFCV